MDRAHYASNFGDLNSTPYNTNRHTQSPTHRGYSRSIIASIYLPVVYTLVITTPRTLVEIVLFCNVSLPVQFMDILAIATGLQRRRV